MAFCTNCGSSVEGKFCGSCGNAVGATGTPSSAPSSPESAPISSAGLSETSAGALAYVLGWITGVLFLILEPYNRNKFVRFHAFQSIFFNIAWFLIGGVGMALSGVSLFLHGFLAIAIWSVLWLGGLSIWILLIVNAANHKRLKLPIIGDMAEKQSQ